MSIEQLIAYSIIEWGAGLWLVGWLDRSDDESEERPGGGD
ncbi:hypothetical protein SEA_RUTHERFERD_63 [Mycobacterium phage Rutherferd]|nr:hypothetical protein SEA_RUTHERFERD_63 [Mycobacterium phage Rutherferd]